MVAHTYNPRPWEAEAKRLQAQAILDFSEAVSNTRVKGANQKEQGEERMGALLYHRVTALKSLMTVSFRVCVPKPTQV